jgi:fumarate reductase subunit D
MLFGAGGFAAALFLPALIAILSLTLWHCAHHLRHLALDLAGPTIAAPAAYGSYGTALVLSLVTVALVLPL